MTIEQSVLLSQAQAARGSHLVELKNSGFTVLRDVFSRGFVHQARARILENYALLKRTRPTLSARHLAGFHRYPELTSLHDALIANETLSAFLSLALDDEHRPIGLSDITINRSQQWHNDLLRGKYRAHLDPQHCWNEEGGGVLKVLLYLQAGNSLQVIPGSHLRSVSLKSDEHAEPADSEMVVRVPVQAGDVVIMDIRLRHRGSTEEQMRAITQEEDAKMLVSTVVGAAGKYLTDAMERGNLQRLRDWDSRVQDVEV